MGSGAIAFTRFDRTFSPEQVALISDAKSFDFELPSFKQELVYNGRTGSTIRFMYREYKDDLARPAFTQNLVYDLKQSNNVVFQSVELEVLEQTLSDGKVVPSVTVINSYVDLPKDHISLSIHGNLIAKFADLFKGLFMGTVRDQITNQVNNALRNSVPPAINIDNSF